MEKKQEILQELQQISPVVAAVANHNMYTAPDGYFDDLAEAVLAGVRLKYLPVMPVPFTVPAGYFDNLAAGVLRKIHVDEACGYAAGEIEELAEIAPLFNISIKKSVYTAPAGYFESLPGIVLQKVKKANTPFAIHLEVEQLAPLLTTVGKMGPYTVPVGYFDGVAGLAMQKIQEAGAASEIYQELEQVAPLLNTIRKKPLFTVPAEYFENLSGGVINKLQQENGGKRNLEVYEELELIAPVLNDISKKGPYFIPENYFEQFSVNIPAKNKGAQILQMHSPKIKQWVVWLAAACITALVVTGADLYWSNGNAIKTATTTLNDSSLSDVSDEEISNYLDSTPAPGAETIPTSVLEDHIPEIEPALQNMSNQEIEDYLDKNSDPGEKSLKDI